MELITIKNLSFSYPTKKNVLKKVNLKIEEGKFTCIVGENGSGKSTLIKCIVGLNEEYEGKIDITGKVGYLPQKTEIQSNFPASVEEVVLSGTISRGINNVFYTKEDKDFAAKAMKDAGIYDIRKKSFSDLSGGQQQRVLIARSLCGSDSILILDEPTNGLDPKIAKQIYELLNKLKKDRKMTILMVSHDVDRAFAYADNIIEIVDGKVSFTGDVKDYTKK